MRLLQMALRTVSLRTQARAFQPHGTWLHRACAVVVDFLVEGSNAEASGVISSGDTLLATTAALSIGPKFERKLIPSRYLDFDTIMGAIGSNEARYHKKRKNDVILQFARPGAPYESDGDIYADGTRGVTDYLKSLEFPPDSPWRVNRG